MNDNEKQAIAWQWLYSNPDERAELEREYRWLKRYLDANLGKNWYRERDDELPAGGES
jgi:hypothetical protein